LSTKAKITNRGAVLLGKALACDAFDECRPLRVVTHAHADHMMGLNRSLRTCRKILMTRATKDLIDVIQTPLFLKGGHVQTLAYGETYQHEEERITLFGADHILGAAQVLVEDHEGTRIVYTGDFRIDATPIVHSDVLVIEATYGGPSCRRPFQKDITDLLISLVERKLKQEPVYIFGYHGKLQEVMQILHNAGVEAPFVMPEKIFNVSRVCERHGMRLGRLMLSEEDEARELMERNSSFVAFHHMVSRSKIGQDAFRICVSGWEFGAPCREISDREFVVALSDHSDFNGLVEYVRRSKPTVVITDNYRSGYAEALAREIHERFCISSVALPTKQFSFESENAGCF